MLVARRDPPIHVDARDAASPHLGGPSAPNASKLARLMTVMQLTGSLLAVPIGIASAYSFYRANFSPDTTCQTLRSNIVAMLDKSVDASTRRALVRRDVEAFEKTCGTVDPDATAAFKTLLADEKTAVPAAAVAPGPKVQRNETTPKETVRKVEPRPQAEPRSQTPLKQAAPAVAPAASEPARRDAAISDTQWLDAVRHALVPRTEEARTAPASSSLSDAPNPQPMPRPAVRPISRDATSPPSPAISTSVEPATPALAPSTASAPTTKLNAAPASTPVVTSPSRPLAAPALPPAIAIGPPPPAVHATDSHPVPPESIPDAAPPDDAKPDEPNRSRIGKWISAIPLLGPVLDNARH